jgi:hypothetical protein
MGVFGSNPQGTGGLGRHSLLLSSPRPLVLASSAAAIGAPCHPFAFAPMALTGPKQTMRKNLVIVRAGDNSLHSRWLGNNQERDFDLLVSYYGATPGRFEGECDHYHAMAGPRWPAHHAICSRYWDLLSSYDRVAFVCDDLDASLETWTRLFEICRRYELDLAQPAILGYCNHQITLPQNGVILRYTNFVEIMCPVLSARALERVRGSFGESISGWGLEFLWSRVLPYPDYKVAIVDCVCVVHTGPARQGSLRPVLDRLGIDPDDEFGQLMRKHGVETFQFIEHARLANA